MGTMAAHQQNGLTLGLEGERRHFRQVRQEADAANGRGRQDGLAIGLVVERDIAGNDREIERPAGFSDALDGAHEGAHDLRPLGIAEIEIVGDGDRIGADGGQIAPAFGDRLLAAFIRVSLDIAGRHIGRDGKALGRPLDADDARIAPRNLGRIRLDQVIILLPHPTAGRHIG